MSEASRKNYLRINLTVASEASRFFVVEKTGTFPPILVKLRSDYLFSFHKRTDYLFSAFSRSENIYFLNMPSPPSESNVIKINNLLPLSLRIKWSSPKKTFFFFLKIRAINKVGVYLLCKMSEVVCVMQCPTTNDNWQI